MASARLAGGWGWVNNAGFKNRPTDQRAPFTGASQLAGTTWPATLTTGPRANTRPTSAQAISGHRRLFLRAITVPALAATKTEMPKLATSASVNGAWSNCCAIIRTHDQGCMRLGMGRLFRLADQ